MPWIRTSFLRLAVLASVAFGFVWTFWLRGGSLGSGVNIKDGLGHAWARTTPELVLVSSMGLGFYCLLLNTEVEVHEFRIASMWARAAAFIVDFWFAVFVIGGILGLVPLTLEAHRTGSFQWSFDRAYLVASDWVTFPLTLVGLCVLVGYFLLPLMKRSPTVGSWIFRLATVNDNGDSVYLSFSTAGRRLLAEIKGLRHPIRSFRDRDERGRTFYDRESGLTVIRY